MLRLLIVGFVLCITFSVRAQDFPVITRDNIMQLTSHTTINYADAPAELGRLESGGFALSGNAERLAVRNRNDAMVVWDTQGNLDDIYTVLGSDQFPDTIIDSAFNADGTLLASIVSDGAGYALAIRAIEEQETVVHPFVNSPDVPLRVWFDREWPVLWLEVSSSRPGEANYIALLPYAVPEDLPDSLHFQTQPSAPEHDPDAFARVGRIAPPFAVTSSQSGDVKVWDLQTGEVVGEAQVEGIAVFGGLNASGTHLVWRDPNLDALHLLDFTTGEDRVITELEGAYISYLMLTPDADVILGVHVADQPVIVAWDTETGERYELGEYRQCARTPDMARLSRDGTTLIIGCDTGLDIWRVQ